jgi:hypothetical protein
MRFLLRRAVLLLTPLFVALAALVVPAGPAAAENLVGPITMAIAGQREPIGGSDPFFDVSTDGGQTWRDATLVSPHPNWGDQLNTAWLSTDVDRGVALGDATALFRRAFELPAGLADPAFTLCVHADNAAVVRLNGTVIGEQLDEPLDANFQNPADCFSRPDLLVPGQNVVEVEVHSHGGELGLNIRGILSFWEDVDAAPVLILPPDVIAHATSPSGVQVWYPRADAIGTLVHRPTPTCTPPAGSVFRPGTHLVECTATNPDSGASSTGTFRITVTYDDLPPVLHLPVDGVTVQAADPSGAVVTYEVAATDDLTPVPQITCDRPSGAAFVVGTSTVTCTATDSSGQTVTGSFPVTVTAPNAAPVLGMPADMRVTTSSTSGAVVTYTVTATDDGGWTSPVSCTPATGHRFPVGRTSVTCTVSDGEGVTTSGSFVVTVTKVATAMERLGKAIKDTRMPTQLRAALAVGHHFAAKQFAIRRTANGCLALKAIDVVVAAQKGKALRSADATALRGLVGEARREHACS